MLCMDEKFDGWFGRSDKHDKKIKELKHEIAEQKQTIAAQQSIIDEFTEKLPKWHALQEECVRNKATLKQINSDYYWIQQNIYIVTEYKKKIAELEKDLAYQKSERVQWKININSLNKENKQLIEDNEASKQQIEELKTENVMILKNHEDAEDRCRALQTKLEKKDEQLKGWKGYYDTLQTECKKLEHEVAYLKNGGWQTRWAI